MSAMFANCVCAYVRACACVCVCGILFHCELWPPMSTILSTVH